MRRLKRQIWNTWGGNDNNTVISDTAGDILYFLTFSTILFSSLPLFPFPPSPFPFLPFSFFFFLPLVSFVFSWWCSKRVKDSLLFCSGLKERGISNREKISITYRRNKKERKFSNCTLLPSIFKLLAKIKCWNCTLILVSKLLAFFVCVFICPHHLKAMLLHLRSSNYPQISVHCSKIIDIYLCMPSTRL